MGSKTRAVADNIAKTRRSSEPLPYLALVCQSNLIYCAYSTVPLSQLQLLLEYVIKRRPGISRIDLHVFLQKSPKP